jgi:murein DD-endopeptidase MepM/ murein hydrolase activator NlpD
MRASRSYNRTAILSRDRLAREAARDAAARAQTLRELYEKAAERSDQIEWMTRWVVPVSHYEITATFGDYSGLWASYHTGLDFAAPEGTPVMATAMGEVTSTTYDGSYGNRIVITHDDGTQTWYCHLSSFYVSPGESVGPGTTIGAVGSTGNTTGPHLHLEVHPYGGAAVDPYTYLQARGAL